MSTTRKNLQIDILPDGEDKYYYNRVNLYIDGICYKLLATEPSVQQLVRDGLLFQVKGMRHNDKDELVEFDYPEGIDGSGVKYTSVVFEMKPKHINP